MSTPTAKRGVTAHDRSKQRKKKKRLHEQRMSMQEQHIDKEMKRCLEHMESNSRLELSLVSDILDKNWKQYVHKSSAIKNRMKTSPLGTLGTYSHISDLPSVSPLDPDFPYRVLV